MNFFKILIVRIFWLREEFVVEVRMLLLFVDLMNISINLYWFLIGDLIFEEKYYIFFDKSYSSIKFCRSVIFDWLDFSFKKK